MSRPSKMMVLFVGLLAPGACTTPMEPAVQEAEPVTNLPEPDPEPAAVEPETTETEVVPETPKLSADEIIGLEPVDVQNLLGPVSLKRWEGEAQVMQFTNEHCVIDIYFYETAPGEAFEASYLNSRTNAGSDVENDLCLTSLLPGGTWAGDQAEIS